MLDVGEVNVRAPVNRRCCRALDREAEYVIRKLCATQAQRYLSETRSM